MNIETTEMGTFSLIVIMTAVTILTRWGGIFVMSYLPINYCIQQFIAGMSGSVLIAIIAPMFLRGDHGAQLALLVTAMGTLTIKRPLVSIIMGIIIAAITRHLWLMTQSAFKEATNAKDKELFLIDGATHIETYWKPQYVDQAMGKLTQFYGKSL